MTDWHLIPSKKTEDKVVFCPLEAVKKAVEEAAKKGEGSKTRSEWLLTGLLRWLRTSGPVRDDSIYTHQSGKKTKYTPEEMAALLDIAQCCSSPAQTLWAVLSEDGSVIKDYRIGPIV